MNIRALCPLLLVLLATSACSGRQPTEGVAGLGLEQNAISPLYAMLFVEGQRFDYLGESTSSFWDDSSPDADEYGMINEMTEWTVSCNVAEVRSFSTSTVSRIECDGDDRDLISGSYAADPAGLWRLAAFPDSEDALSSAREELPMLPPEPEERLDNVEDEWGGSSTEVGRTSDGSWCVGESYWGGDESFASVCLAEGRGITLAEYSWSGGAHEEIVLRLADE